MSKTILACLFFSLLFCIAMITIFSCNKNSNPNSVIKACINVTLTSPKGTDSQTIGFNVPINPISYTISNNQSSDTSGLAEVSVSALGLPAGITTSYTGGVLTISGAATKDSSSPYVYTIVATGNTCSVPLKGVISVKTCATINLTSISSPFFQVVPADSAIAPITYSVGGGGTGANVTGLPSGVTGNFSGGIVTISGTLGNLPDSLYRYKITTSGGYCNAYDSGIIVVTNCPMATLTSAASTVNQIVSLNQAIQPITYSITGHYTSYSIAGLPWGVTATFNGGIITITGAPTLQYGQGQGPTFDILIQFITDDSFCNTLNVESSISVQ
jgi:hypothetical protein